ncbi:MAG TPA: argininosuccinate lyase [Bacteroidales bacterium]|nr:argininosuccinate lyase [Bacteroidales bacterium]
MKLWDKGFDTHKMIEKFTVGNDREHDLKLAKHDVKASLAHAKMLESIGILSKEEFLLLEAGLKNIAVSIENGSFRIEQDFEDVHSKIEFELIKQIGESAKKIHTARSRNDQVLVALHLYIKEEIEVIVLLIRQLFETLLALSEKHKEVLMPGYTHFQIAMPSSFGLWFSGYAESLVDDVILLNAAFDIADQNPLGSAAGYGSSFPIDRQMTTDLLEFNVLKYNSIAAQMSRGKLEKSVSFALASVAATLAKLAMDITIYNGQNFGFISFPNELTTGSSIMPHKKNPDVFELIRAHCNKIQSVPAVIGQITANLPSGYHRDYQLLKEELMLSIDSLKDNLSLMNFAINQIEINPNSIEDSKYDNLYSVEAVNKLVLNGMSFREAYQKVGIEIENKLFVPEKKVAHTHEGSIGNLCLEKIAQKFERQVRIARNLKVD